MLEIKSDAIFIADSHTQNGREVLILALEKMLDSPPSQIFFMGDISNILVGNLKSSLKSNQRLLNALDSLSQNAQIIYFEGNHDFNLAQIFKNAIIIRRESQPILARFGEKIALLAHGDIFCGAKYEIYIKILTSKITAKILQTLDSATFGRLYGFIENMVKNKKIRIFCDEDAISALIKRRIQSYQDYISRRNLRIDLVIEGHFHLGKIINGEFIYIALPAFAKDKSIFCAESCAFLRLDSAR